VIAPQVRAGLFKAKKILILIGALYAAFFPFFPKPGSFFFAHSGPFFSPIGGAAERRPTVTGAGTYIPEQNSA
jgi:hypothetical protein